LKTPGFDVIIPFMTVKADTEKRIVLPTANSGDVFNVDVSADGKIVLTKLVSVEPITVRPKRVNGRLQPPEGLRPSRETIAAAVRSDRDER
jgi:hypothetical protein